MKLKVHYEVETLFDQETKEVTINSFYNDDFKIIYTITNSNSQAVIKEITFELIESQPQQTIQLSNLVTLEVDGTKGRFIFNK